MSRGRANKPPSVVRLSDSRLDPPPCISASRQVGLIEKEVFPREGAGALEMPRNGGDVVKASGARKSRDPHA